MEKFLSHDFDGLVLSPGPKKPSDAGLLMQLIDAFHDKKPILGICLGHQGIGEYFGAELVKSSLPMHGKTSEVYHNHSLLFNNIPSPFEAMRYHSLILKNLDTSPLIATSFTNNKEIMSLSHKTLPIHGVQFHPESILTPFGLHMLNNWLKSIIIS